MLYETTVSSGFVLALLLVWMAANRKYVGVASHEWDGVECAGKQPCVFCSYGKLRSTAQRANGGRE